MNEKKEEKPAGSIAKEQVKEKLLQLIERVENSNIENHMVDQYGCN